MRVCGEAAEANHLSDSLKLVNTIAKSDDYWRAYKSAKNKQLIIQNAQEECNL